jgi:hypothetical protein
MASKKEQNKLAKVRIVIGVARVTNWAPTRHGNFYYSLNGDLYTMAELTAIEQANPNVTFNVTK